MTPQADTMSKFKVGQIWRDGWGEDYLIISVNGDEVWNKVHQPIVAIKYGCEYTFTEEGYFGDCEQCAYNDNLVKLTKESNTELENVDLKSSAHTFKQLVALIDQDGNECLYVDGVCWRHTGETTVYAADLADAASGEQVSLHHTHVQLPEDAEWPASLEDALKWKIEN